MSAEVEVRLSNALKVQDRDGALAQRLGAVTLMHRVRPGNERAVAKLLASTPFGNDVRHLEGVHFLRLFVIDGGSRLVLCGEFDAPVEDRLAQLCLRCRVDLGELWAHCEGFPAAGSEDPNALAAFLAAGFQPSGFRYSAFPQTTVQQIRRALDWMRKTVSYQIELAKKPYSS